jgi:trehalose-6-phosphate synthase
MRKSSAVANNVSQLDGVVIVSFFLPVIISKNDNGLWTATWDTENILSFQTNLRVSWIGIVRHSEISGPLDEASIAEALLPLRCFPVFLDNRKYHDFYDIFCKQILWPVLHHVAGVYGTINDAHTSVKREGSVWLNYMQVNVLSVFSFLYTLMRLYRSINYFEIKL